MNRRKRLRQQASIDDDKKPISLLEQLNRDLTDEDDVKVFVLFLF
jgi:hypothetical protein